MCLATDTVAKECSNHDTPFRAGSSCPEPLNHVFTNRRDEFLRVIRADNNCVGVILRRRPRRGNDLDYFPLRVALSEPARQFPASVAWQRGAENEHIELGSFDVLLRRLLRLQGNNLKAIVPKQECTGVVQVRVNTRGENGYWAFPPCRGLSGRCHLGELSEENVLAGLVASRDGGHGMRCSASRQSTLRMWRRNPPAHLLVRGNPVRTEALFHALDGCTVFMAIGTSGMVKPAASFVANVRGRARTIYVGPEEPANTFAFSECPFGEGGRGAA